MRRNTRRSVRCTSVWQWWRVARAAACLLVVGASTQAPGDEETPAPKGRIFLMAINRREIPTNPKGLLMVDPETGRWTKVYDEWHGSSSVSPDGRYLAYCSVDNERKGARMTWLADLRKEQKPRHLLDDGGLLHWSSDSRSLIIGWNDTWLVDVDGKKKNRLSLPMKARVEDWSRDGKRLVVSNLEKESLLNKYPLEIMNLDGTARERILEPEKGG